jgi:WD40 repeat protein
MSCDILPGDEHIITTSINGEVSVYSTKTQSRVFFYETIPLMIAADKENRLPEQSVETLQSVKPTAPKPKRDEDFSNLMYICRAIKGVPGLESSFLVGAQDKTITRFTIEDGALNVDDYFTGHSMGLRSIELSRDGTQMATGCEDHSLRIWDFNSYTGLKILAGHQDVVVSSPFLFQPFFIDRRSFPQQGYPSE